VEGEVAILGSSGHWARHMKGKAGATLYSHYDVAACLCCGAVACRFRACTKDGTGRYPPVGDLDVTMVTLETIKQRYAAWQARQRAGTR
jgi:hypothetical protein